MDAGTQLTRIGSYGLLLRDDQLLLCRLSRDIRVFGGMWTLPGGGLEFGEHPEAGMVREVQEETGLMVRATSIAGVDSVSGKANDQSYHSIRIIYHAETISGSLRNEMNGSTDRCQWHAISKVRSIGIVNLVEAALPMLNLRGS